MILKSFLTFPIKIIKCYSLSILFKIFFTLYLPTTYLSIILSLEVSIILKYYVINIITYAPIAVQIS